MFCFRKSANSMVWMGVRQLSMVSMGGRQLSMVWMGVRQLSMVWMGVRQLSMVSNKRITRIPSETTVGESELAKQGNERVLSINLTNRNPRNLEQMLMQPKPLGFELEEGCVHYWNRISFEKKSKHLTGKVIHHSGRVLLNVTSSESSLAAQLSNLTSLQAASLVGKTLAMRALEAGITNVYSPYHIDQQDSQKKVDAFVQAVQSNGLELNEQPMIFARQQRDL